MGAALLWVRSALFQLSMYGLVVILGVPLLPLLLSPGRAPLWACQVWARASLACLRLLCGVRAVYQGLEHLLPGPVIVAAKHQSAWETLALMALLDNPAIVLKQELIRLPVFGWFALATGCIPVDREGTAKAMRIMLRAAGHAKNQNRPILIFPEGTRTPFGSAPSLLPGVVGLYKHLGVSIVPVALDSGRLWPRKSFLIKPGVIHVRFLPPIAPGLEKAQILEVLHTAINRDPAASERKRTNEELEVGLRSA
jgi:1-acyl-sn-glycerol-3-phosphate acyltransferase